MIGIYDIHHEPESDMEQLIAIFSTPEKCKTFLEKLKQRFPMNKFEIFDWVPPKINPEEVDEVL